jgi:hypothetical protein
MPLFKCEVARACYTTTALSNAFTQFVSRESCRNLGTRRIGGASRIGPWDVVIPHSITRRAVCLLCLLIRFNRESNVFESVPGGVYGVSN